MSLAGRASAVVVAACLTLGVGASMAGASSLSTSSSVSVSLSAHGSTPTKTYAQLLGDYHHSLVRINHSYGQRVSQALAKYRKSLAKAKNSSDKLNARATYRTAVVAATTEREVELETLGSPPSHTDQSSGDSSSSGSSDN